MVLLVMVESEMVVRCGQEKRWKVAIVVVMLVPLLLPGLATAIVVSFVLFRPKWPKHFVSVKKCDKIASFFSRFKFWSAPDFSVKYRPKRAGMIPIVPF